MQLLYLSDILRRAGLDITKVKLIRHALSDKGFYECYKAGMVNLNVICSDLNEQHNGFLAVYIKPE